MGWMALAIIAGLLVYFQVSISDPVAKKRAVFKAFVGLVSCLFLFMAIANYKTNFYGESRLLPVSLVMITVTTFVMALYFTNLSALLKIGGSCSLWPRFFPDTGTGCLKWKVVLLRWRRRLRGIPCPRSNWLIRVRRLSLAVSGKVMSRGPSEKGNVRSATHSMPECWGARA